MALCIPTMHIKSMTWPASLRLPWLLPTVSASSLVILYFCSSHTIHPTLPQIYLFFLSCSDVSLTIFKISLPLAFFSISNPALIMCPSSTCSILCTAPVPELYLENQFKTPVPPVPRTVLHGFYPSGT